MTELDRVVKRAIKESVDKFECGVKHHDLTNPKTTIPDETIDWLKTHKDVIERFRERLKSNPKQWETDGPRVCKAAFDAGSLAAFYAMHAGVTEVSTKHVELALEHISTICTVGFAEFIYCPWRPGSKNRG